MNQTGVFIGKGNLDTQKDTRNVHTQKETMWEHSKRVTICEPKREASGEAKLDDTLILEFWPSELWKKNNKLLLLKPLSGWYSVMAALANEYTIQQKIQTKMIYYGGIYKHKTN